MAADVRKSWNCSVVIPHGPAKSVPHVRMTPNIARLDGLMPIVLRILQSAAPTPRNGTKLKGVKDQIVQQEDGQVASGHDKCSEADVRVTTRYLIQHGSAASPGKNPPPSLNPRASLHVHITHQEKYCSRIQRLPWHNRRPQAGTGASARFPNHRRLATHCFRQTRPPERNNVST